MILTPNRFALVRHLRDQNALRSHGHDGPLEPGQENILDTTLKTVLQELSSSGKNAVRILYTNKTNRIRQTAEILGHKLQQNNIPVSFTHERRLEVMDQGDLCLPENYQDGEWFKPLEYAWDAICDEAYIYDNIFYRFGDPKGKGRYYSELENAFSRYGQSLGWTLIHKYSLINDIVCQKLPIKDNEFLVIACQSDLPLILIELQILSSATGITPTNLPAKSWEVYKQGGLQDEFGYDIPMGYTRVYDLSSFLENKFIKIVSDAGKYLAQQLAEKETL